LFWAFAGVAPLTTTSCIEGSRTVDPSPPFDYAISPNGRTIAYGADGKGIGLYDWQSGSVRYLTFPSELHVAKSGNTDNAWPSFSSDGTKIVALAPLPTETGRLATKFRLVIIDIVTGRGTALPVEGNIRTPVFRPDGKAILYAAKGGLFLFDLEMQSTRPVLSEGSGSFFNLGFIDNDTIFFKSTPKLDPKLTATLAELRQYDPGGKRPDSTSFLPFMLKMGSAPVINPVTLVKANVSAETYVVDMTASRDGERIAFIGINKGLYVFEGGQVRMVNDKLGQAGKPRISWDGSTAVLDHKSELVIVNLDTGKLTNTDFVSRVYWPSLPSSRYSYRVSW
jgi:Tol biopolymer transport system component